MWRGTICCCDVCETGKSSIFTSAAAAHDGKQGFTNAASSMPSWYDFGIANRRFPVAGEPRLVGAAPLGQVRLPILHIVVTATPPHDYKIYINRVKQKVTEESKYAVARGMIDVSVERVGIPACTWSKEVEDDEEIDCIFVSHQQPQDG
jgi:hypothetical protein